MGWRFVRPHGSDLTFPPRLRPPSPPGVVVAGDRAGARHAARGPDGRPWAQPPRRRDRGAQPPRAAERGAVAGRAGRDDYQGRRRVARGDAPGPPPPATAHDVVCVRGCAAAGLGRTRARVPPRAARVPSSDAPPLAPTPQRFAVSASDNAAFAACANLRIKVAARRTASLALASFFFAFGRSARTSRSGTSSTSATTSTTRRRSTRSRCRGRSRRSSSPPASRAFHLPLLLSRVVCLHRAPSRADRADRGARPFPVPTPRVSTHRGDVKSDKTTCETIRPWPTRDNVWCRRLYGGRTHCLGIQVRGVPLADGPAQDAQALRGERQEHSAGAASSPPLPVVP